MSARIISVANQKGGVGKTATTTNLGTSLYELGHRVLVVDMDPQGNLSSSFGTAAGSGTTVAEALLDRKVPIPIVPIYGENGGRLDLVPTSIALATAEAALIQRTLASYGGNVTQAARRLGISRTTLWRKKARYGL